MDKFQTRGMKQFWEISAEFFDFLRDKSPDPDSDDIDDMILFLNNIVLTNPDKQVEGVEAWCDNMAERLDPKHVRYAKALDRILDKDGEALRHGAVAHALAYRDSQAADASSSSTTWKQLQLTRRLKEGTWSDADVEAVWRYIEELGRAAYQATGRAPPRIPTRDELAESIRSKKQSRTSSSSAAAPGETERPSLSRAFEISVLSLCESRGAAAPEKDDVSNIKSLLTSLVPQRPGGPSSATIGDMIDSHNASVLPHVHEAIPKLGLDGREMSATEWNLLTQATAMCRMERAIPSTMMSTIEKFASSMASNVMSGKMDMSTETLERLSTEVMGSIDPSDIEKMGENVGELLPVLNSLRQSMAGSGA